MANKKLLTAIGVGIILVGGALFLQLTRFGTEIVWSISSGGTWLPPLVLVSALIDSINPCAFSILLLTIAFLFSMGKLRSSVLKIGGFYIAGIFVVYLMIGLGILQTLHLFSTPHFMARLGAFLLIALGAINLINEFFPKFPIKLRIPNFTHRSIAMLMEKGSVLAVFLLGMLVGICEFPCTGGPYLMVLGLLHDQATYVTGVLYLIAYNLVFVAPLVVALLIASNKELLEKAQAWRKSEIGKAGLWSSIAMIVLGFLILMF
ncbi:MAG: cytochrome c biogenesis protein CcdA [Candidatus Jorgensenbacteria bacterium]|nr:cytochrome c biogenesis protein CcdA [Candidatus Jorgensenbacteria bacterium]